MTAASVSLTHARRNSATVRVSICVSGLKWLPLYEP
jgi:hypothetical protein